MNPKRDPVTDLLRRARRRLTAPSRWTQKVAAVDGQGYPAGPKDATAVAWCAVGALLAEPADGRFREGDRGTAYTRLYQAAGAAPEEVNDRSGHQAVLEMYDAAIRAK